MQPDTRDGPSQAPAKSMAEGTEAPASLVSLQIQQAVTSAKVEEVGRMVTDLRGELRELKANFATKGELKALEEEVQGLRQWNKWVVQVVGAIIISGLLGLIILKGGVVRP